MTFPGGLLIGCDAGTLNAAKIKGSHTAMWSGILAAESLFEALKSEDSAAEISEYTARFKNSDLYRELHQTRNFSAGFHKFGFWLGSALPLLSRISSSVSSLSRCVTEQKTTRNSNWRQTVPALTIRNRME